MFRKLSSIIAIILFSMTQASAADYVDPQTLYPVPQVYGSYNPTQVNYNNSYLALTQYSPSPGGTAVSTQFVNSNSFIASSPAVASLEQRLNALQQYQNNIASEVIRGVAAVSAMANIWMPSAPGRTAWAVNGSFFANEVGAGISVAHRLNLSIPIAITASYGNGGGTAQVGRVGLMGEF